MSDNGFKNQIFFLVETSTQGLAEMCPTTPGFKHPDSSFRSSFPVFPFSAVFHLIGGPHKSQFIKDSRGALPTQKHWHKYLQEEKVPFFLKIPHARIKSDAASVSRMNSCLPPGEHRKASNGLPRQPFGRALSLSIVTTDCEINFRN